MFKIFNKDSVMLKHFFYYNNNRLLCQIIKRLKMVELKLKNKKDNKELKQELNKTVPLNLIDIYMGISLYMFSNKNIKIKSIDKE